MNLVLPCFQSFLNLIMDSKQSKNNVIIRRYTITENNRSNQDNNSVFQFQQSLPNNYTQFQNADIFVMPDVEAQINSGQNSNNLLINKCQGGSFVVMRNLENVYIDSCSNGEIFMGPCHSTIFIRNCKNMRIRTISQQLRIQNSENIIIQGIVGVKPVLEDCRNIKLYSLTCRMYGDLVWQIETAKIDIFKNQIYECYDFTPKKIPNFSCGQEYTNDNQPVWQAKIQLNDLDWGFKNSYLPSFTSVKKSMLKKVYNQYEVKNNENIVMLFTKMNLKQFIAALNCQQLCKNFTIIARVSQQNSFKMLKNIKMYKQKLLNTDKQSGDWHFLMIKLHKKINKDKLGVVVVQDRDIIWRIFNSQDFSK